MPVKDMPECVLYMSRIGANAEKAHDFDQAPLKFFAH